LAEIPVATLIGLAAFAGGLVFGAIVQRTHFCTMGAIADLVLFGDWRRMRAWLTAIAVALILSQALQAAGAIDLGQSLYLTSGFGWLGAIIGGLIFGFGMTLTGGCSSRSLVRFGAGNLKSVVVLLVMGLFAYMTMSGLLSFARLRLEALGSAELPAPALPGLLGLGGGGALLLTLLIGGALLFFCLKDRRYRASPRDLVSGFGIGLLIAYGWAVTAWLGADPFDPAPLESFTFVAPMGRSLIYLMTFPSAVITFGVAAIGGVVAGALIAALAAGDFRFEAFTGLDDMARHLIGAAMMGTGGVLALGCTIGQGMTGVSTLAPGSILALAAIIAGGVLGVRYLEQGSLKGAFQAAIGRARAPEPGE
jgi:uncharacterized membrane protein YedE/YeeE